MPRLERPSSRPIHAISVRRRWKRCWETRQGQRPSWAGYPRFHSRRSSQRWWTRTSRWPSAIPWSRARASKPTITMNKSSRIFVAGHRGLVGAALVRRLQAGGYSELLLRERRELDLTDQSAVDRFFAAHRPEY